MQGVEELLKEAASQNGTIEAEIKSLNTQEAGEAAVAICKAAMEHVQSGKSTLIHEIMVISAAFTTLSKLTPEAAQVALVLNQESTKNLVAHAISKALFG